MVVISLSELQTEISNFGKVSISVATKYYMYIDCVSLFYSEFFKNLIGIYTSL